MSPTGSPARFSRRELLTLAGATFALPAFAQRVVRKGRIKQSVCRWTYQSMALPDLCRAAADIGLSGIDLLQEADWGVPRQYGLVCSMAYAGGGSIPDGLNVKANHDAIVKNFERLIPRAETERVPNVITFFGNKRGMPDDEAIANCVEGLNRVKRIAEDHGVTICVELLNSKVNHKDYQGDRTSFGAAVIRAVNSPRVKLLYDIYHMQIMEGDVIRTIRDHKDLIAHFHTGGVPGRHELDDTQELNWRAVCRAIADTGFAGYVAHEFQPTRDPLTSLREAVAVCDV
ncbi:MAG TPA: sugar phosphate isomerase/epimerase family protein [Vicinamibacterales bacterium]|nr:sugar phosphate isomerase/epimerase family protein [Vicinamibacterales bacterium]